MREALDPSMWCCRRRRVIGVARALQVMGDGPGKGKIISNAAMPPWGDYDALRPTRKRGSFTPRIVFHRGVEKKGLKALRRMLAIHGKICVAMKMQ
ncbi:hypothetical protein DV096_13525 [Bradymonadaceae bacterium TMQ3]|nr:hypothetical protein DV096_13525 [Bradymonadaceae bacterium TMQ3]